jgi:hypothetical protein
MSIRILIFSILIFTLFSTSSEIRAATLINVDQNALVIKAANEGTSSFSFGVFRRRPGSIPPTFNSRLVQTFTAGSAGRLDHIEFQIFTGNVRALNDRVRFTLIDGDYAAGSRSIAGFQDVNFSQIPDANSVFVGQNLISFDTSTFAYSIRPGQRYSVVFEALPGNEVASLSAFIGIPDGIVPLPGGGFEAITRGSGYTGGGVFFLDSNGLPDLNGRPQDIGFRSFFAPAAVPEPESWLMMIVGFAGIGVVARQKSRQVQKI